MDTNKVMRFTGFAILGSYAVFNIITLVLMNRMFPQFGPELFGPYSIMASKQVFIAYHVWGIIIAIVTMYAMWKDIKVLFMIGLLLMSIIMFYPYFSTTPAEKQKLERIVPPGDSVNSQPSGGLPAPDTIRGM